jgi:hypothetical protein
MRRFRVFVFVLASLLSAGCSNNDGPAKPPIDTESPHVTILQPVDSAVVAPGALTVRMEATDNKAIARVQLFDGSTKVGDAATAAPNVYEAGWTVSAGAHTLRAVAFDAAENTGEDSIYVSCIPGDTQAPLVAILQPASGSVLDEGEVVIRASATDDNAVTKVEFFDGTTKIGEDLVPDDDVYEAAWSATSGNKVLRALAWDEAGNAGADTIYVAVGRAWGLEQNTPNPFCPDSSNTTIRFSLLHDCHVHIAIQVWDTSLNVKTLLDEPLTAGVHTVTWDGRNDAGQLAADGDYCCGMDVEYPAHLYIFPCTKVTVACSRAVAR